MKIEPGPKPPSPIGATDTRAPRERTGKPAQDAGTPVSLSPRIAQLQQLEAQLAAIPVVDRSRVDAIKAAIASGEYAVKPENIADGLIDEVKEMLHAVR